MLGVMSSVEGAVGFSPGHSAPFLGVGRLLPARLLAGLCGSVEKVSSEQLGLDVDSCTLGRVLGRKWDVRLWWV